MLTQSTILEIREKTDIADIIGETVNLRRKGANHSGLCPFHAEKTPSFSVSPSRQTFKCFGCGKGGDVFTFVMERDGVGFTQAAQTLAKKAGVEIKLDRERPENWADREKIAATLAAVQAHFTRCDDDNPATAYWKKRGFTPDTLETFGIGHCDTATVPLIGQPETELAGISNEKGNLSFFSRTTIPLHDSGGNIIGFAGRSLDGSDPKYINNRNTAAYTKSKFLFNLHRASRYIRESGEIMLVEGYADVMAAWQMGFKNCLGVSGLELTDDHVAVLKKFNGERNLRFVVAFDNEIFTQKPKENTVRAFTSALAKLLPLGEVLTLDYPRGSKDIGEMLEKGQDLSKQKREDALMKFFFSQYDKKDWGDWTGYKKAEFQERFAALLSKVKNAVARDHYINDVAATLQISPKGFNDLVKEKNSDLRDNGQEKEATHIWVADDVFERQIDADIHTKTANIHYIRRSKDVLKFQLGAEYLRKIPRFDNWFCQPEHIKYQRVVTQNFGDITNKFFNSYHPLPYKAQEFQLPEKFDDTEFDLENIKEIKNTITFLKHIYNSEKYGLKFFRLGLDYLTIMFKHPARRLQARAFVSTEEGTGKSTVIDYETALFGQNATKSTTDKITQRFNSLGANKLLIAVEETKDDRVGLENLLKDLITGLQKVIEFKGRDAMTVRSFDKYLFASNHPESFLKVGDATSRFAVVDVPVLKNSDNYFLEKLVREIPYMMHFLEKRQIWTPDTNRLWFDPTLWENEALAKLRQASKDQVVQSMEDLISTIFLKTKLAVPVLRFSSAYLKNILAAWGGKHLERTPTQITSICTERMRLRYSENSTRFKTYKILPVANLQELHTLDRWETEEINDCGRYIEFPIWKFLNIKSVVDNFDPQDVKNLAETIHRDSKFRELYGNIADGFARDCKYYADELLAPK